MAPKTIRADLEAISCAVCERRLLQGERPETYLAGGSRRTVCELCTTRASHQGWIREEAWLQLGHARHVERRPLLSRFRTRRVARYTPQEAERLPERNPGLPQAEPEPEPEVPTVVADQPVAARPGLERLPPEASPAAAPVQAAPTSDELKAEQAIEVFNASEHPRTISGVARSLGAPQVTVRPSPGPSSVVSVVVAWELCWYRYAVDLAQTGPDGVTVAGQGYELSELAPEERDANAAATERGAIVAAGAPAR